MSPLHCFGPILQHSKSLTIARSDNLPNITMSSELPLSLAGPEPEEPFFLTIYPLPGSHSHLIWITTNNHLPAIMEGKIRVASEVVLWFSASPNT